MPGWFLGTYAVISGAVLAYKWFTDKNRSLRDEIKRMPVTRLADLTEPDHDVVRIRGTLRYAEEPLIAPISQRPCAAWHILIWRLNGEQVKQWELVDDNQQSQSFLVDDEGTHARVDNAMLDLLLHPDRKAENRTFTKVPPEFEAYLQARSLLVHTLSWGRHAYRIHEGILEESERVTIVGRCVRRPLPGTPGQGYRDVATELVITPLEDDRLLASDEAKLTVEH